MLLLACLWSMKPPVFVCMPCFLLCSNASVYVPFSFPSLYFVFVFALPLFSLCLHHWTIIDVSVNEYKCVCVCICVYVLKVCGGMMGVTRLSLPPSFLSVLFLSLSLSIFVRSVKYCNLHTDMFFLGGLLLLFLIDCFGGLLSSLLFITNATTAQDCCCCCYPFFIQRPPPQFRSPCFLRFCCTSIYPPKVACIFLLLFCKLFLVLCLCLSFFSPFSLFRSPVPPPSLF